MLEEKFKENYWMFINLFEYANKLLEGGNVKAQHSFYDIFLRDHKNVTFENIKIIIPNANQGRLEDKPERSYRVKLASPLPANIDKITKAPIFMIEYETR